MRWIKAPFPEQGQKRTIQVFLWWPRTIQRETRWLESAQIIQRCYGGGVWLDCEWAQDEIEAKAGVVGA